MPVIGRHRVLYILLGIMGLSVGTLVYLIDRDPEHIYFIYHNSIGLSLYHTLPNLFGPVGKSLPTFIHVFSFILLTAGFVTCSRKGYFVICLCWVFVDLLFELGQKFKTWSVMLTPDWFSGIPYLENSRNYFLYGSFDLNDIGSVILGAILAYVLLISTTKEECTCGKRKSWEK